MSRRSDASSFRLTRQFRAAHSPDNSFLGFVVEHKSIDVEKMTKKPQMLVYGKELDMWKV